MGHSFDDFRTGLVVRWEDRGYFRVRARRAQRGIEGPVICLETIEGRYFGEIEPEALLIPPASEGAYWPEGYELPERFAIRVDVKRRAAFLESLKGTSFPSAQQRPYGLLVSRDELEASLRRFKDSRADALRGRGSDPHRDGYRRYCAGCGIEGTFPQRATGTPAHAACVQTLKSALIHYCTYCSEAFERRDYPQLKLMYWRRIFICPAGSRARTSSRLNGL